MVPPYTGHSPDSILKRELLPQPFGPVMSKCIPGLMYKLKSGTMISPVGVTTFTFWISITESGFSVTSPKTIIASQFRTFDRKIISTVKYCEAIQNTYRIPLFPIHKIP